MLNSVLTRIYVTMNMMEPNLVKDGNSSRMNNLTNAFNNPVLLYFMQKYNLTLTAALDLLEKYQEQSDDTFKMAVQWMLKVFVPFLVITGLPINFVALALFVRKPLRKLSSSSYLIGLACSSTVGLVVAGIMWSWNLPINVFFSPSSCKALYFLHGCESFLSLWYLVAFITEQFINVYWPLHVLHLCSKMVSVLVAVSIGAVGLLGNSYIVFYVSSVKIGDVTMCSQEVGLTLTAINAVFNCFLPYVIIIVQASFILRKAMHTRNMERLTIKESNGSLTGNQTNTVPKRPRGHVANNFTLKICRYLLVVATVFLLFSAPFYTYSLYLYSILKTKSWEDSQIQTESRLLVLQSLFRIVSYCNHATCFYLYILCSSKLRGAIGTLAGYICRRKRNNDFRGHTEVTLACFDGPDKSAKSQRSHYARSVESSIELTGLNGC